MAARKQYSMLEPGTRAPEFELRDSAGNTHRLKDLLARRPVLLAFFKTSCPVCQYTFPFLERLYQVAGRSEAPIQILGVSQDKAGATREFMDEFGVTFPTLLDDAGYAASNAFGIHTVPSLFLIEQDGSIAFASHGFGKSDLEALGQRIGAAPFEPGERIPEFRPG